ncbi:protein vein [Linepithema humile]|uniref:protein vein n=1 Tax=Linepithema humile TaxID=83485 RepID=UPI000623076E|nr:PREDICTED: protein vein [Linepithema humile]
MMWAPLLLAGFLSGWWGALALAAAPPAIRDTLGETSRAATGIIETRYYRPRSLSVDRVLGEDYQSRGEVGGHPARRDLDKVLLVDPSSVNQVQDLSTGREHPLQNDARRILQYFHGGASPEKNFGTRSITSSLPKMEGFAKNILSAVEAAENARVLHPEMNESGLTRAPHHSSSQTPLTYPPAVAPAPTESSMERPRIVRSTKQRPKNRTKADSPREQRRRCKNKEKGCRGQNWCPAVDVGNRAFLAPTVFEGKARSMSSLRKPGSNYAVTFEVKQVYKSQPGFQPLQKNDSVRLHFRDKLAPGKSTVCNGHENGGKGGNKQQQQQQQQQQRDNPSGVVRANIKRGKVYLVFVNRVGPRNFTILGEPVIRSKKNEQAVQAVVRPDYVREVTLSELRDSIARLRDRVKLVCRTRGSPPPKVHWLKDGVPLHPRRGLRIQHKRRRSKVVISSAKLEDSGRYECVAESTSGHQATLAAQLLVTTHDTKIPETTTTWIRQEQPCPIAGDFCMNGGTCLFFETVGEPACRCAEGFTGLRCETKDVSSTGSVYNRHRVPFSCKLGLSTSYYC